MKRPLIIFCLIVALIQLGTVFFMIAAAARGNKQAEDFLGGAAPPSIEVWHRWSIGLVVLPLIWIAAVSFASAEGRHPKATVCLVAAGLLATALLLFEAARLLFAVIYLSAGCGHGIVR